jgi:FkbM family methyltransferase
MPFVASRVMAMCAKHEKDLIYDVGMHMGEDTEYYLKKGFRVIAFEANPNLVSFCRNRFSVQINNGRLLIVEGAIVDNHYKTDYIDFYVNDTNSVWGTVSSEWVQRNATHGTSSTITKVPRIDFAECLRQFGIPYYLKVDIEGMDSECLKSLMSVGGRPAYISIESEKKHFSKLDDELSLLLQLGYTDFQAIQQATVYRQVVPYPAREGCFVEHQFKDGSSGLFGNELPLKWKTADQIKSQYKRIFLSYQIIGEDYGLAQKFLPLKAVRKAMSIILNRRIPGWYDTHARHSSVSE